jgi:hypothetical protein
MMKIWRRISFAVSRSHFATLSFVGFAIAPAP